VTLTPTIVEGPLRGGQLEEAAQVSVRAFADDPFFRWLFPNDTTRERSTAKIHAVVLRHLSSIGTTRTAFVDGKVAGVALWLPPGSWPLPPMAQVRQLFGTIPAFRGSFSSLNRARPLLKEVAKAHPKRRHWYLQLLMTDPPYQRQGIGGLLQNPTLEICDREGLPAWLETQKHENLAYYARFGFEVVSEHKAPGDGPSIWSLNREPKG
jgi:GNAT superfamily N-acetyltransferase